MTPLQRAGDGPYAKPRKLRWESTKMSNGYLQPPVSVRHFCLRLKCYTRVLYSLGVNPSKLIASR